MDSNDLPVFTTGNADNASSSVNGRGFSNVRGVVVDPIRHRLYAADEGNARVLVFNLDSTNTISDRVADYVLGQADFASTVSTTTQSGMRCPHGLAFDPVNERLFVSDVCSGARRILIFNTANISTGMNASFVLGAANFTTAGSGATNATSGVFYGLAYDSVHGRLFAADVNNGRVLVWSVATGTVSNGMTASFVLGDNTFTQADFVTSASSTDTPEGVAYDPVNDRLFMSDNAVNRVLIFNVASGTLANGMAASFVLGQTTFTANSLGTTQSKLRHPNSGLAYNASSSLLYVGDSDNTRIMIFSVATGTVSNGMDAFAVLGVPSFTDTTLDISQSSIGEDNGLDYDPISNSLFIGDDPNSRVLVYRFINLPTSTLSSGEYNTPYTTTLSPSYSQGTVSFALASGTLPTGVSLSTSSGILSGAPSVAGSYTFGIAATDTASGVWSFTDTHNYTLTIAQPSYNSSGGGPDYVPPALVVLVPPSTPSAPPSTPVPSSIPPISSPPPVPAIPQLFLITKDLKLGITDPQVKLLQIFLNTHGFTVSSSGAGSTGNETAKFGSLTKAALIKFQEAYASEILTPLGLTRGTGFYGPMTRRVVERLGGR